MDIFQNLMHGFSLVCIPLNISMALLGCFLGTIVGILPGLGPGATMAILIPFTFGMSPTAAMILLTAIYYGSKYGGSVTAILINVPGESASVVTTFDGYAMARQGRAGAALGISAIGSFIAGILGTFGVLFVAVPLAEFAVKFGPAEYFSLILMAMLTIVFVGGGSITKSLISGVLGFALGVVGADDVQAAPRFVYGIPNLLDGVPFVPVSMGLFGIGEVLVSAEERLKMKPIQVPFSKLFPSAADFFESKWAIIRGSVVGFFVGVLPGAGATIASFITYGLEKAVAKHPERFGKGAIEGVAAPESANNSAPLGALVPMLALGIPGSTATAIILGAMILYGIKPGPLLFHTSSDLVFTLIAAMFVGNAVLLIMNLPMVPLFAYSLRIPYGLMYPGIIVVCVIGAFSLSNSFFDVWVMFIFGIFGYFMKKHDIPMAPLVIALVLGRMLELSLYQALSLAHGDITTFVTRPISACLLGITAAMTIAIFFKILRTMRKKIGEEDN
jgi:putative tricarboxylic transport membrane protein